MDGYTKCFCNNSFLLKIAIIPIGVLPYLLYLTVIGCPNVRAPSDTSTRRDGNKLVIICNHTGETTTLTCKGNVWFGEIRNCTPGKQPPISDHTKCLYVFIR